MIDLTCSTELEEVMLDYYISGSINNNQNYFISSLILVLFVGVGFGYLLHKFFKR